MQLFFISNKYVQTFFDVACTSFSVYKVLNKEAHALKIGDIKKTVAAFSLQHGVYTQLKPPSLNTLKSCKTKTNPKFGGALFSRTSEFSTHQNNLILAFHQFEAH